MSDNTYNVYEWTDPEKKPFLRTRVPLVVEVSAGPLTPKDEVFASHLRRILDQRFPDFLDCAIETASMLTDENFVPVEKPDTLFISWLLGHKLGSK